MSNLLDRILRRIRRWLRPRRSTVPRLVDTGVECRVCEAANYYVRTETGINYIGTNGLVTYIALCLKCDHKSKAIWGRASKKWWIRD